MDRRDFGRACIGLIATAGVTPAAIAAAPKHAICQSVTAQLQQGDWWVVSLEYDCGPTDTFYMREFAPKRMDRLLGSERWDNRHALWNLTVASEELRKGGA